MPEGSTGRGGGRSSRVAAVHAEWKRLAELLHGRDEKLRPIIEAVGSPRPPLWPHPFRGLAEAILYQQLAPKAADTIAARFRALEPPFPRPESILAWRAARFRAVGVSRQKTRYLKSLSERWVDRAWRRGWERLDDGALVERLTEVDGIGEWTAHMFLIFGLGRPDVLATGDYGIRRALALLHGLSEIPGPREIAGLVPHWRGMASIGSWYLWQGLDRKLLK